MMYLKKYAKAATVVAAFLLSAGCGGGEGTVNLPANNAPKASEPDSPAAPKEPTGTIRGRVLLKGDMPTAATEKITADTKICGTEASLPRIVVDSASKGIEGTIVYVEGAKSVGGAAPSTKTILIDQKNCQYVPHSLVVPLGSKVEIVNSDPILHNVHGTQDGGNVFNYAQPKQGERQAVDTKDMKPGVVTLTCEAGHPWMNAFLYVAKDPVAAITDKAGEFVIKDVPPGTYTIKMWHEGVQIKKINKTLQTYEYEAPYELSAQVTVVADMEATANFELTLRK